MDFRIEKKKGDVTVVAELMRARRSASVSKVKHVSMIWGKSQ